LDLAPRRDVLFLLAPSCNNEFVIANGLAHGVALFNEQKFFEAHEALEDVWRAAAVEHKKFLQGLVQAAVAFHHYSTGNRIGMRSVMARSIRNLSICPDDLRVVDVEPLLRSLTQWLEAMDNEQPLPPLPEIRLTERKF
jgi:predicted metal-dependent hydrolase